MWQSLCHVLWHVTICLKWPKHENFKNRKYINKKLGLPQDMDEPTIEFDINTILCYLPQQNAIKKKHIKRL